MPGWKLAQYRRLMERITATLGDAYKQRRPADALHMELDGSALKGTALRDSDVDLLFKTRADVPRKLKNWLLDRLQDELQLAPGYSRVNIQRHRKSAALSVWAAPVEGSGGQPFGLRADLLFELATVGPPVSPVADSLLGSPEAKIAVRALKLFMQVSFGVATLKSFCLEALMRHVVVDCGAAPAGGADAGEEGAGEAAAPSATQILYMALQLFTLPGMTATEMQARVAPHVLFDCGGMFDRGDFINWRARATSLLRQLLKLAGALQSGVQLPHDPADALYLIFRGSGKRPKRVERRKAAQRRQQESPTTDEDRSERGSDSDDVDGQRSRSSESDPGDDGDKECGMHGDPLSGIAVPMQYRDEHRELSSWAAAAAEPPIELFEWCVCDLNDDAVAKEVYELLSNNYVEDDDNMFRFNYSTGFLKWCLLCPGSRLDWMVGVRVRASRKLVGFISAVPAHIRAGQQTVRMVEINFLCVHKKLRSKRLAPVLIKEITRRVNLCDIWQAAYTAGVLLPKPVATCRYYHRSLNPRKLIDVGFSRLPPRSTMARTIKLYKLPDEAVTPGLREARSSDAPQIAELLNAHLSRYKLTQVFNAEEVAHWFQNISLVVNAYVVEPPDSPGTITDVVSFYTLPSSILGHPTHTELRAAYLYYTVATTTPLKQLVNDAMIRAAALGYDVFNALDLMLNESFLKDLKFGQGDGQLHYYLYNWRLGAGQPMAAGDVGLVLM
ncbi:hypothetical protein GPECTOR_46g226 [Gonium pectorale]|uniref:Glycylpeptide N-tetradecanoyltransferase n=1 Tax=Gonium pectorale TaxID=33097 RepID=A0A150G8I5_GONPE|nr:hypothetical protein GPECTOR_46g226 [Gonium pectorale]|eukprot:KXZ46157.1 hypothetical protein GPECTOR_46g226 [Gonium pectorale]